MDLVFISLLLFSSTRTIKIVAFAAIFPRLLFFTGIGDVLIHVSSVMNTVTDGRADSLSEREEGR